MSFETLTGLRDQISSLLKKVGTGMLAPEGSVVTSAHVVQMPAAAAAAMNLPAAYGNQPSIREVAVLSARATEVFGSSDKAMRWLETPVPSLGHRTPLSLAGSAAGMAEVEDTLGAIEHGIW